MHYFAVRGMEPSPPQFPLVGIVYRDRAEFARHAAAQGDTLAGGVVGYYNIASNRINLYEMGGERRRGRLASERRRADPRSHASDGVQHGHPQSLCPPPKWIAEGLAMLFEAPAFTIRTVSPGRPIGSIAIGCESFAKPSFHIIVPRCWPRWPLPMTFSAPTRWPRMPKRGR